MKENMYQKSKDWKFPKSDGMYWLIDWIVSVNLTRINTREARLKNIIVKLLTTKVKKEMEKIYSIKSTNGQQTEKYSKSLELKGCKLKLQWKIIFLVYQVCQSGKSSQFWQSGG